MPRRWRAPKLKPEDQLVEATIVHDDGSEHPIVVVLTPTGVPNQFSVRGFSRGIDLPAGARLEVKVPPHLRTEGDNGT